MVMLCGYGMHELPRHLGDRKACGSREPHVHTHVRLQTMAWLARANTQRGLAFCLVDQEAKQRLIDTIALADGHIACTIEFINIWFVEDFSRRV